MIEERKLTDAEKKLVLMDLSARLTHRVMIAINAFGEYVTLRLTGIDLTDPEYCIINDDYWLKDCLPKPYLKDISKMTDEEAATLPARWRKLLHEINEKPHELLHEFMGVCHTDAGELLDWIYENHYDWRGLIDMDLAIEVTEENSPYKT